MAQSTIRPEGWEHKLSDLIESARCKEYRISKHDCALFVNEGIKISTGKDYSAQWKGKYSSSREALKVIAQLGFRTLREATSHILGRNFVPARSLSRGDPALYIDASGQQHLGICMGATVVCLLEGKGIVHIPLEIIPGGWKLDDPELNALNS